MKELYITNKQYEIIKESVKKDFKFSVPAAQDQVNKKVNAGIMDAVTGCGVMEGAEPESDTYNLGMENDSNLEYGHVYEESENKEEFDFKKAITSILDYMKAEGLNIHPFPSVEFKWEEQNGLFITTGYYVPTERKIVLFCKDRHPKDILRSFAHEVIHHMQNLEGQEMDFTSIDNVKDNKELEKLESEAYLKGNIYFRKWTEYERQNENSVIAEWFVKEKTLLNENIINESVSPVVYHFTDVAALYRIMLSDKFYLKTGAFKTFSDSGGGKRMFYLSTTRNKNAYEGYSNKFVGRRGVRITLDGNKLNQKYYGSSFNYWGDGELGRMKYLNPEKVGLNKNWSKSVQQHRDDETEDRIWSYKSSIPNAWDYILRVDICINGIEKDNDFKQVIYNIFHTSEKFTKKINLYDDIESFALGNKNTIIPKWLNDNEMLSKYVETENEYSLANNIRIEAYTLNVLAAALALMTYFEPNDEKNKKVVEYCKKYGFQDKLNSNLFLKIKKNYYNNIQHLGEEIDDISNKGNKEYISKIRDMVSHWMRKSGFYTIKDILKQYELPQYMYESIISKSQLIELTKELDESLEPDEVDLSSFNIKKNLNPKFWKDGKIDSRIRMKLLDIADDFIDFLGINWVKPDDIIITGSLANFNWDKEYSDIDLHILIDYSKVDKRTDFVSNYFYSQKKIWNEEHKGLKIYGFPIEVYVQDTNETHNSSGVYSLEKNKWLEIPERDNLTSVKVNKSFIKKEVSKYTEKIDFLIQKYIDYKSDKHKLEIISKDAEKLFDEIKAIRKNGFNNNKNEISEGNIIYKSLRRLGYIGKLLKIISLSYDKMNSLP